MPQLRSERAKTWQSTRAPIWANQRSKAENLVFLGQSMREGGALKFANFEKVRFLAPPSGVV